jgi:phosphatidyl-myo-inositol alpha-mannosyltransferase
MSYTIAFFSKQLPSDAPNGVSCQVHRLANALVRLGDRVTCYSFSPAPDDALYSHARLEYGSASALLRKLLPAIMFRRIKTGQYDILHYHGDDFLCKGDHRRVRTFYGSALFEAIFAAGMRRFLYQSLFYAFEMISCGRRGVKVGISELTTRALPGVRHIIHCGVPLNTYAPGGKKTGHPTLLFIGDLDSRKRGRMLVDLFTRRVIPVFPNATLTVVGPQKAEGAGVVFAGRIPESDLVRAFRESWIYCSVSSYEGFGVPLIEAMACGTTVAAIDTRGAREIITHEYDGLLCMAGTLFETLTRLISDATLRERLAENGLRTIKKFDIDTIARRYKDLYSARYEKAHEK